MSRIKDMSPNQCVSWWLMASYAYYELMDPILDDEEFDQLTVRISEEWGLIDHPHKSLITSGNLESGSGFDIEYPTIVKFATGYVLWPV